MSKLLGGKLEGLGGEASPLHPPVDETLVTSISQANRAIEVQCMEEVFCYLHAAAIIITKVACQNDNDTS